MTAEAFDLRKVAESWGPNGSLGGTLLGPDGLEARVYDPELAAGPRRRIMLIYRWLHGFGFPLTVFVSGLVVAIVVAVLTESVWWTIAGGLVGVFVLGMTVIPTLLRPFGAPGYDATREVVVGWAVGRRSPSRREPEAFLNPAAVLAMTTFARATERGASRMIAGDGRWGALYRAMWEQMGRPDASRDVHGWEAITQQAASLLGDVE